MLPLPKPTDSTINHNLFLNSFQECFVITTQAEIIDASTSRLTNVSNMAVFWSKRAPKTIAVNGNRMEFCRYFLTYR